MAFLMCSKAKSPKTPGQRRGSWQKGQEKEAETGRGGGKKKGPKKIPRPRQAPQSRGGECPGSAHELPHAECLAGLSHRRVSRAARRAAARAAANTLHPSVTSATAACPSLPDDPPPALLQTHCRPGAFATSPELSSK